MFLLLFASTVDLRGCLICNDIVYRIRIKKAITQLLIISHKFHNSIHFLENFIFHELSIKPVTTWILFFYEYWHPYKCHITPSSIKRTLFHQNVWFIFEKMRLSHRYEIPSSCTGSWLNVYNGNSHNNQL